MNHNPAASLAAESALLPALSSSGLPAIQDHEIGRLRAQITDLLAQAELVRQQHNGAEMLESHLVQLREANEHLVLATFSAQDKQADAEDATQRQSQFLSMLAHELRNPLQPIAHANALLAKLAEREPALIRLHGIIGRQIVHMSRLVDDLLDASRISSGKIALNKTSLLLAELIATAVELSRPLIEARQQRLQIVLPAQALRVVGDSVRLAQVFSNLLNNASKFSPEHQEIEVSAKVVGAMVEICVRDHGIGMPTTLLPSIFDLFTQGVQTLDRVQGGLGIGLTLVRTLVELHGGAVQGHSDGVGCGSLFTVLLPLSMDAPSTPATPAPPLARPRRRHVLLVEDNHDASETLSQLLELGGHTVVACYDGAAAIALALGQRFDVLICDLGLPGLDGLAVVAAVHAGCGAQAPYCIATSGYSQQQDRTRALKGGFDYYLVKPVAVTVLLALIDLHGR